MLVSEMAMCIVLSKELPYMSPSALYESINAISIDMSGVETFLGIQGPNIL